MSIDISRLERYILNDFGLMHDLGGYKPKEESSVENYYSRWGLIYCGVMVLCFALSFFSVLPLIAHIHTYRFFWLLLLVPLVAVGTIKMCIRSIGSSKWDTTSGISAATIRIIRIVYLLAFLLAVLIPQGTIIDFVFYTFLGLCCVVIASKYLHKAYLIRKYAQYFKDERLRPFTPAAAPETVDVVESAESSEPK